MNRVLAVFFTYFLWKLNVGHKVCFCFWCIRDVSWIQSNFSKKNTYSGFVMCSFHAMQCIRSPQFSCRKSSPVLPLILGLTRWQMSRSQLFPGYFGASLLPLPTPGIQNIASYLMRYIPDVVHAWCMGMFFLNSYMPNHCHFISFISLSTQFSINWFLLHGLMGIILCHSCRF